MKNAYSHFGMCSFNNRYIFAFGGKKLSDFDSEILNSDIIEKYDNETNCWIQINLNYNKN